MKKLHNWYFGVVIFQFNTEGMLFVDMISTREWLGKSAEHIKSQEVLSVISFYLAYTEDITGAEWVHCLFLLPRVLGKM